KRTVPLRILALALIGWLLPVTAAPGLSAERHIHPGDKLSITIYNHPELSQSVSVDAQNHITLPLAGTVDTVGADERTLAARIRKRLLPYVDQAAVEIHTTAVDQSLLIDGGPVGSLPYTPGESLASAITQLASLTRANGAQGGRSGDFFHGSSD